MLSNPLASSIQAKVQAGALLHASSLSFPLPPSLPMSLPLHGHSSLHAIRSCALRYSPPADRLSSSTLSEGHAAVATESHGTSEAEGHAAHTTESHGTSEAASEGHAAFTREPHSGSDAAPRTVTEAIEMSRKAIDASIGVMKVRAVSCRAATSRAVSYMCAAVNMVKTASPSSCCAVWVLPWISWQLSPSMQRRACTHVSVSTHPLTHLHIPPAAPPPPPPLRPSVRE
jgi:hypothetical protein